jgi:predicted phosphoribosyltransferase
MYKDRIEAGYALANELKKYKNKPGIVLAVPRGGIPIAYVVAKELELPMDILLTKKIGHPHNREYAIGAVSLTDRYISNREEVSQAYIDKETIRLRQKLKELNHILMGDKAPEKLEGKIVIIIDDGIATGSTLLSTIKMIRKQKPAKLVIAAPVASSTAIEKLSPIVDELICPLVPEDFWGVGIFYENFEQVSDTEAKYFINKLKEPKNTSDKNSVA